MGANFRNPTYADDLDRISLGILLDIDNTDFNRLTDYVLRMDKQAKPSNLDTRLITLVYAKLPIKRKQETNVCK